MGEPLKYMYNPLFFDRLCPVLEEHLPGFERSDFIVRIFNNHWPDLELKQRVRHIATVFNYFLPPDFTVAVKHLVAVSKALESEERSQGFANIFLADYVEAFGLDYPDESLDALGEITRLVSAEFAVRPFLIRYQDKTMEYMYRWSLSRDANVRRLASEGCRPRLPWAMALTMFKQNPAPILPVLENLKQDPSLYVRKSVANNLNDIAKDNPKVVIELARSWKDRHADTDWILRRGCRSLMKKGDAQVLSLHGFNPEGNACITKLLLPPKVEIGHTLEFSFSFVSREKAPAMFRLDYAIDYATSSGRRSRKVFKISESVIEPGKAVDIKRKRSFRNFSTRKQVRGKHVLTLIANGKKLAATEFIVC